MFSGIVEEVGVVLDITANPDGKRFRIGASGVLEDAEMGESISVSGTCLTVVDFTDQWFDVEATLETLRCTTLGERQSGDRVNLEKALRVSDRLGGHIVSGHVDAVGRVTDIREEGFSKIFRFTLPACWAPYFVEKGSVTVDGVSLTVVEIGCVTKSSCKEEQEGEFWFSVALIPHTMTVTTLGSLTVGASVNVETDVIARYVIRLIKDGYVASLNKERDSLLSG